MSLPFASGFRKAVVDRLVGDSQVLAKVNGKTERIVYRPKRNDLTPPVITFGEQIVTPDPTVPLRDITLQVDVWMLATVGKGGLDAAAECSARIIKLIDFGESVRASISPFYLPSQIGRLMYSQFQSGSDMAVEEGDLVKVPAVFALKAYATI